MVAVFLYCLVLLYMLYRGRLLSFSASYTVLYHDMQLLSGAIFNTHIRFLCFFANLSAGLSPL